MSYQFHSEAKKTKALNLRAKGLSFAEIGAKIKVPTPTVYKWHRDAQPTPSKRLTNHEMKVRRHRARKFEHIVITALEKLLTDLKSS